MRGDGCCCCCAAVTVDGQLEGDADVEAAVDVIVASRGSG